MVEKIGGESQLNHGQELETIKRRILQHEMKNVQFIWVMACVGGSSGKNLKRAEYD